MNYFNEFKKGIWQKNPVLVLNLGLCPAIAVTTSVINSLWMALALTFVLVFSNMLVSLLKNYIPSRIRIPVYITIIATLVTIVELILNAFYPGIYKSLGIYIPLLTVNCLILGRAEAFASKNGIFISVLDGLGIGAGFALILFFLGALREILGANTFFGYTVIKGMQPSSMMILAPGAFLTLGIMLWGINAVNSRKKD